MTFVTSVTLYGLMSHSKCNVTDKGIYPWNEEDPKRRIQAFPVLIEQILQAPPGSFQVLICKFQEN